MKAIVCGSLLLLAGCAGYQTARNFEGQPVARYLAWMDGDYQSNYEANREIAASRLEELEAKPPAATDKEAYLEYLSLLGTAGKSADAEKKIKAFLAENPNEKRAVFILAVQYWRNGKKELAGYFFNQLEKEASFPWKSLLYNNLGMIALQEKNRQQAIGYFEKATKAGPSTPAPLVYLGALYLQSRSYAAAEPLFERARSIDPDMEDAAIGLGIALEGQGKVDEANGVYQGFMSAHPQALSVLYNTATLLGNRLGRKEDAAQLMLRYVQRGGKETAKAQEIIQSWR